MSRRAVINGRFLSQPMTGVQRYAREITAALDALLAEDAALAARWEFELVAPAGAPCDLALRRVALRHTGGQLTGHAWEQLALPGGAGGADALVSLANTGPLAVRRQLVVMHDAAVWAVPHTFSRAFRGWYRVLLPGLARRVARVGTVSEFSRRELGPRVGLAPRELVLLAGAAEHALRVRADHHGAAALGLPGAPFVLAVGSNVPHKQFAVVEAALARPECAGLALVVVGGAVGRTHAHGPAATSERTRHLGRVPDGVLRALYERAVALAFPSSYEGFGLPPLEAMASGCPVVASRAGALPEVCGDAALYCPPGDAATLAGQLARLARDPSLRAELAVRGRRRAAEFSWRRTALGVVAALDAIVGCGARGATAA